jgi:hypothetical protein
MKQVPPELFQQMLDGAKLSEREIAERLAQALDPGYWRGLLGRPQAGGELPDIPNGAAQRDAIAAAIEGFKRDGVYHVRGALGHATLGRIITAIDAAVGAGWPPVFAFAFDELWTCARLEPIRLLVAGALGEGARQIPHVWTHVVKPRGDHAGWPPHVDGPGDNRMTVWIALTDAAIDNGCMYAVPRSSATSEAMQGWFTPDPIDKDHVKTLLQATQAMPASAGDLVGWAFDIAHWGGRVSAGAPGRRSISLEFIAPHAEPGPTDVPLVSLSGPLPSHADRLRAIAAAVLEYKKFEPLVLRYQELARRLMASLDQASPNTTKGS